MNGAFPPANLGGCFASIFEGAPSLSRVFCETGWGS